MLAGLLASILTGLLVDRTRLYKTVLIISTCIFIGSNIGLALLMEPGRFWWIAGLFALQGFAAFGTYPSALEMGSFNLLKFGIIRLSQ